jgi:hypothetical protein
LFACTLTEFKLYSHHLEVWQYMGRRLKAFFASTGEYYLTKTLLERKDSAWRKSDYLVIFAALVQKIVVPKFDLSLPKYMWECVWNYSLKAILGGFCNAG